MKIENSDVVIIGSGVAGLICALSLDKKFKIILLVPPILHREEYLFVEEKKIEKNILRIL